MLHGTASDNMASDLVRSTIVAIRQRQPELAAALVKKLGLSSMAGNGMGDLLDDFAGALKTLSGTAADIYATKLQAEAATTQAKQAAEAEAAKMQAQIQQQQLVAQSQYAQQQLAQQQIALQQYQTQLKSGSLNTALMVGGLGIVAVIVLSMMKKRR